jgi:hypothetical protein
MDLVGRADPEKRWADPLEASMGTSGVRVPPQLTSAEASAQRAAQTPVSAAAFMGRAPRLATFGRASAV